MSTEENHFMPILNQERMTRRERLFFAWITVFLTAHVVFAISRHLGAAAWRYARRNISVQRHG